MEQIYNNTIAERSHFDASRKLRTKIACSLCKKKHIACSGTRPCDSCVRRGIPTEQCVDSVRRKLGRPPKPSSLMMMNHVSGQQSADFQHNGRIPPSLASLSHVATTYGLPIREHPRHGTRPASWTYGGLNQNLLRDESNFVYADSVQSAPVSAGYQQKYTPMAFPPPPVAPIAPVNRLGSTLSLSSGISSQFQNQHHQEPSEGATSTGSSTPPSVSSLQTEEKPRNKYLGLEFLLDSEIPPIYKQTK